MKNNAKGFTIIELLVVISIIGLLSTISVVALNGARKKSRDAKRVGDVKQIQTALELAFNDGNAYPTEASAITLGTSTDDILCYNTAAAKPAFQADTTGCDTGKIYLGLVPAAPTPAATPAGYSYISASGSTYTITFGLEDSVGSLTAGYQYGTPNGISK